MFNLRTVALAAMIMVVGAGEAFAEANCWCLVSINNLTNLKTSSGVIKDYGTVGAAFTGITQQSDNNQTACNTRCTQKASPDTGSAAIAASACSAGASNGTAVRAWSKVGTREYKSAQQIGTLIRANAVYSCPSGYSLSGTNCSNSVKPTYTCPSGTWTEGAKCVRQGCAVGSMNPKPNAWVGIAPGVNSGGNATGWNTDDQGGTRFFSNATGSCSNGGTIVNGNCVKTIAATVQTPAICKF